MAASRTYTTAEPEFTKAECVVGLECRVRKDKKWHTGKIVRIHQTDTGLQLYRFLSVDLYILVTRDELKKT